MLKQATYCNGTRAATVRLERLDALLKSETEALCFPRLIELDGGRLVLVYFKKWHEQGGAKTHHAALSEDFGKTWVELAPDSPWCDHVMISGILGDLSDGQITYIDGMPRQAKGWKVADGPYHNLPEMKLADPEFRIRRFSKHGDSVTTDVCRDGQYRRRWQYLGSFRRAVDSRDVAGDERDGIEPGSRPSPSRSGPDRNWTTGRTYERRDCNTRI